MISITHPVFFAIDSTLRELADVAGIDLRINGKGDIKAILLHLINIPQAISSHPPGARLAQAREGGESYHNVTRPAVIHIAEHDLELLPSLIEHLCKHMYGLRTS